MFNTFPPSFSPSLPLFTPVITFYLMCVCVCVRRGQFALRLFSCSWNWNYLLANWRTCWDWGKPRWPSAPWGRQTDRQIESVDECFGRISKFALSSYIHTQIAIHNQRHFKLNFSHTQFVPCPCPALPRKQTKRIEFHMRQIFNLLSSRFISKEGERGRGGRGRRWSWKNFERVD